MIQAGGSIEDRVELPEVVAHDVIYSAPYRREVLLVKGELLCDLAEAQLESLLPGARARLQCFYPSLPGAVDTQAFFEIEFSF